MRLIIATATNLAGAEGLDGRRGLSYAWIEPVAKVLNRRVVAARERGGGPRRFPERTAHATVSAASFDGSTPLRGRSSEVVWTGGVSWSLAHASELPQR